MQIGLYTIVLLVGPSNCGKSTWSKNFQQKTTQLHSKIKTSIVSSDDIRRELLGTNLHKYNPKMLEVSDIAFDMLFSRVDMLSKWPVNHEFIVVDTTGLDSNFRSKIQEIAKKNNYNTALVLFDYSYNDYFDGMDDTNSKKIIGKHVDTFKKEVLPSIKKKSYQYTHNIKAKKEFGELDIIDLNLWAKSNFWTPVDKELVIVGDVHESVDALKQLTSQCNDSHQLVFVGDLFDKGQDSANMLTECEHLQQQGAIFVVGNHESFIARRLRGEVEKLSNEYELFSSLEVFQSDENLAKRFLAFYDKMIPFAVFHEYGKTIYVTHAPCKNNQLGKLTQRDLKAQRNFYFSSRDGSDMVECLRFIENEAKYSHPMHVFGHVAHAMKHVEMKNKVWLDTGCVYGNKLTALKIQTNGKKEFISIKSEKRDESKLLVWKKNEISQEKLLNTQISNNTSNEQTNSLDNTKKKTFLSN